MLPRKKRLTKSDFEGKRPQVVYRGTLFDVGSLSNGKQSFACVISKKTLKKATERNRVRRQIYSLLSKISITKQNSYIIYPKKEISNTPYSAISEEILKVFATL